MTHPWLAPGALPVDALDSPTPVRVVEVDAGPTDEAPSPVPMRPMTAADILDGAIAVIKAAPRSVFVIAATFVIPLELVTAWVQRDSLADRGLAGGLSAALSSSDTSNTSFTAASVLLIVASGLVLS